MHEDETKRRVVLTVLLFGLFFLSFVGIVVYIIVEVGVLSPNPESHGAPFEIVLATGLFFLALFFFSRAGFSKILSIILVFILIFLSVYISFSWRADAPLALLFYTLAIIISGILLGSRISFVVVGVSFIFMTLIAELQSRGFLYYDKYWAIKAPGLNDTLTASATLTVIALVSWISNREIEKALKRARESETALRRERDMLEIKVEKRAKQIRYAQMKQVVELYRFADFGKLAAGLFHDLVDPLSVISLNLENLNHETRRKKLSTEGKANIRSALKMVTENQRRVEAYVNSTRRQLQGQQIRTRFNLKTEIDGVIVGLIPKANTSRVSLEFHCLKPLFTFGNPVRFHQLMHNLISNAIDSYDGVKRRKNRIVLIKLARQKKQVISSVEDFGYGISDKHLSQIFTPFFTTKPLDKGIGIGLSIAKEIVERDFKGEISVKSRIHKETLFTVKFPINTKSHYE